MKVWDLKKETGGLIYGSARPGIEDKRVSGYRLSERVSIVQNVSTMPGCRTAEQFSKELLDSSEGKPVLGVDTYIHALSFTFKHDSFYSY